MSNSDAHTELVKMALEALAKAGYTAWQNNTGAIKDADSKRFIKFGKKGSGDIFCILPPNGRHAEFEAKTGTGKQKQAQKDHQKFCVEKNGGLYIVFHSVQELLNLLNI